MAPANRGRAFMLRELGGGGEGLRDVDGKGRVFRHRALRWRKVPENALVRRRQELLQLLFFGNTRLTQELPHETVGLDEQSEDEMLHMDPILLQSLTIAIGANQRRARRL